MGARIESLPIPVIGPTKKWSWLVAGILALSMAAAAGSFLALRSGSEQASAPAQSRFAKSGPAPAITGTGNGLLEVANASANLTGHSLVYFTGAVSAPDLGAYRNSGSVTGTGPALAELRGVDVIGISGTGPALVELAGDSWHKARPKFPDCRQRRPGPC